MNIKIVMEFNAKFVINVISYMMIIVKMNYVIIYNSINSK